MSDPTNAEIIAEKLAGRRVILSMSGGKDSSAAGLWLQEHGIEFEAVFMDTGWEHPDTYRYVRETLEPRFGPVRWLQAQRDGEPETMEKLIRRKGMFPSRVKRFCTQSLKIRPFVEYVKGLSAEDGAVVNVVGIRAGESSARSAMPRWSFEPDMGGIHTWRPIIDWSYQDVIDMHARHELLPNPLYLSGASRVGCWPCINARKAEIRHIVEHDPDVIDRIRAMESEVTQKADARSLEKILAETKDLCVDAVQALARVAVAQGKRRVNEKTNDSGETVEVAVFAGASLPQIEAVDLANPSRLPGRVLPAWATGAPLSRDDLRLMLRELEGEGLVEMGGGTPVEYRTTSTRLAGLFKQTPRTFFQGRSTRDKFEPIDAVAEWSKTARGGRQFELLHNDNEDTGCMRWGLCDTWED